MAEEPDVTEVDWESFVLFLDEHDVKTCSTEKACAAENAGRLSSEEQELLIKQAMSRCQELRERLTAMVDKATARSAMASVARIARPLQKVEGYSGSAAGKQANLARIPCRYGSKCIYLQDRACQYYHPPGQQGSSEPAGIPGSRHWNVLVTESSTKESSSGRRRSVETSRSPKRARHICPKEESIECIVIDE
eukprot:TRINITY_DN75849_c0_g1_i1.p1 TRINITY_DN75849_c0_g1~~TRINITY_DN75849_c0_g1_i1.p1  ORF type:complete len:193 (+),score=35.89 TRINITY_DN75849_c0_g1_i1:66-644(+)